jgi:CspA family cold shock protein
MGFLITPNYLDQIRRWGARVRVPQLCARCFRRRGPLPKQRGEVEWFDPRKHYGFIIGDQGERVFLHQNELFEANGRAPYEGQTALYHVRTAAKGLEALNVELVESAGSTPRETREN